MKKVVLDNRNWTAKLQVTLLSAYVSWKKFCSETFKASSEEVILMYCEKMKAKYMNFEDVWKIFFLKLQFGINLSKWTPSNGYFSVLYEMPEKQLWNSLLLYLVVIILQLVHEIAVSRRCSIKEVFWKTSQNSQIKTRSTHPEVLRQKKRCC